MVAQRSRSSRGGELQAGRNGAMGVRPQSGKTASQGPGPEFLDAGLASKLNT